jgi:hypothetical protein
MVTPGEIEMGVEDEIVEVTGPQPLLDRPGDERLDRCVDRRRGGGDSCADPGGGARRGAGFLRSAGCAARYRGTAWGVCRPAGNGAVTTRRHGRGSSA